ncbi:MAG: iron chelate uptake ABC transporter family permease subunit, partial [bacterium]
QRAVLWTTGSLYGSDWNQVLVLAIGFAVLVPLSAVLVWGLRVLQLGDEPARGVGMRVERYRLLLLIAGCGLAAVPVSVSGPIGFVALMVPHAARMIAGPISGGVFLFSGAIGSILVLGADMAGQHALPVGLPVGILTAAIGAPYFLYLLYRRNTRL